jgi:hypothetical protein
MEDESGAPAAVSTSVCWAASPAVKHTTIHTKNRIFIMFISIFFLLSYRRGNRNETAKNTPRARDCAGPRNFLNLLFLLS